jgi:hypothetical protein
MLLCMLVLQLAEDVAAAASSDPLVQVALALQVRVLGIPYVIRTFQG